MDRMLSTFNSTQTKASETGSNATSWADMIKEVEVSKRTLPWKKEEFIPAKRLPLTERKIQERALDPIAMKLRDPMKEAAYEAKKEERTKTKVLENLNHIRTTQFNIINHTGPPRAYDKIVEEVQSKAADTARANHLLTHLPHAKQTTCPLIWNDDYMTAHMPPRRGPAESRKSGREFNIINNQFSENHESMLRAEYETMKRDMVARYWEKHDYNPITCEYYSDEKEKHIAEKDEIKRRTHGIHNDDKLPKSYFYSEGKAYDILTLEVKDQAKVLRALSREVKTENRLNKFKGYPAKQVEAGVRAYDKSYNAQIARVGFERWEDEINRGYDFVTTRPNIASTYCPLPKPRPTAWERIHDSSFLDKQTNANNQPTELRKVNSEHHSPTSAEGPEIGHRKNAISRQMNAISGKEKGTNMDTSRSENGVPLSMRGSISERVGQIQPKVPAVPVPSLDLTKTNVSQNPPSVRTGGLSGYTFH